MALPRPGPALSPADAPNRPCPLCGTFDPQPAGEGRDRYLRLSDAVWTLGRCRACALVYVLKPPPDPAAHYPDGYWSRSRDEASSAAARLESAFRRWMLADRRRYLRGVPEEAAVLEIGGGGGDWAAQLRRSGRTVWLLDADRRAVEAARRRGIDRAAAATAEGDWPADWPWERVGAATAFHVLEHSADPARVLTNLRRHLPPSAPLIVQVPNLASWQARALGKRWLGWDLPRHLTHFTPATLQRLLEAQGWRVERCWWHSRRDSAALAVSSLWTGGDHKRLIVSGAGPRRRLLAEGLYFLAWMAATPPAWIEAAAGRGGVMTVRAVRG